MAHDTSGTINKPWAITGQYFKKYACGDADYHFPIQDYFQNLYMHDNDHLESPTDMMLLKKEQKDAELDKKIEALRKKNEALMKRYQEVEEDKKRAEQEGMSLQGRKGKVEDLTITIKSPTEKRLVTKKGSGDTSPKALQNQADGPFNTFSAGRGKRRQLLVTAPASTKGKRSVSESVENSSRFGPAEMKHSAEGGDGVETTEEKNKCSDTLRASQIKVGRKHEVKGHASTPYDVCSEQSEGSGSLCNPDLDITTSGEEHLEYQRWKKERELIDRERVARHKNSQGQWRRAWDLDKPQFMFSEKGTPERGSQSRDILGFDRAMQNLSKNFPKATPLLAQLYASGVRSSRKGHLRSSAAESHGGAGQREKRRKNLHVVGSKATGKDRLTGRARKWDTKEEVEQLQERPESSLDEFLEELDALCDQEDISNTSDAENPDDTSKAESRVSSADMKSESPLSSTHLTSVDTSSPKSSEKKVRFSEDLIQETSHKNSKPGTSETKTRSLKNPNAGYDSQDDSKHNLERVNNIQEQDITGTLLTDLQRREPEKFDGQGMSFPEVPELPGGFQMENNKSKTKEVLCFDVGSQNGHVDQSTSTEQEPLHSVEHLKNSLSRNTEELIDPSLSVLSLESGDSLPDHSTSTEKARENGKIV